MKVLPTDLAGVFLVEPDVHSDERGSFDETYSRRRYAAAGLDAELVQDNHSTSVKNTVRGLHLQNPHGQVKLCFVVFGEVFDVCVDVRTGSPTFGQSVSAILSSENHRQIWIPAGFVHGFCVLSERADFVYKCGDYYTAGAEHGILWNDPALGIPWPVKEPLLSPKDARLPKLADATFLPSYR